jgi:hypothetical protein
MKKIPLMVVLATAVLAIQSHGGETTNPMGFNTVTCLANSDTIVGVPLRAQGSIATKLAAAPAVNGAQATLTLAHNTLPSLGTH